MLFAQSIEPKDIFTWVLLAVAVLALGGLIAKVISLYRVMKRSKAQADAAREQALKDPATEKLLELNGEYFVMSRDVEYSVGVDGQIKQGVYVVKSANASGSFVVRLNGQVCEFQDNDTVTLTEGGTICPISDSVRIKPYTD